MADQFLISRDRLAAFLPDNDTLRRFEQLFQNVGVDIPQNLAIIFALINEVTVAAGSADSRAGQSIDTAAYLSALLDQFVGAPPVGEDRIAILESLVTAIQAAVSNPRFQMPNSFPVDYIDWNQSPPVSSQAARMEWNPSDDTINIHHSGDVTQQVGLESYARITNNTGFTIQNGQTIGFDPVTDSFVLFLADGTQQAITIIGIATQQILNGAQGRITNWGRVRDLDTTGTPVGEVWTAGDILYTSTTIAGALTNVKPTAPGVSLPIAQVRVVSSTIGQIFVRPTIEQQLYYGSFKKTTDQVPSAANTADAITWSSATIASGVSIGATTSQIIVANAGLYKFSASFQLTSSSASVKNVWFWFRKNGVDIADTSMITSMDSATAIRTPSRSLFFSLMAGDYIEVMWASDSTAVTLDNIAATAFAPAAPAAILTVNQEQQ